MNNDDNTSDAKTECSKRIIPMFLDVEKALDNNFPFTFIIGHFLLKIEFTKYDFIVCFRILINPP